MALTLRSNGVAGGLVSAAWWNDYYSLFTGGMSDQPITILNGISLNQTMYTTPTAPTLALASAASGVDIGAHTYAVSFNQETNHTTLAVTLPGTTAAITVTSGNQQVNLSAIPTGPAGTVKRTIWRSKAGTSSPLYACGTISDNTTTTFNDTTADSSLTTQAPAHDSFGGYLLINNSGGTTKATIYNDGSIWFDAGHITSDGAGNLTVNSITTGGGSLSINGGSKLTIDGTAVGSEAVGSLYVQGTGSGANPSLTINNSVGNIILTPGSTYGLLISGGLIGKSSAGDIIDASGTTTYIKASGAFVEFQSPAGTELGHFDQFKNLTIQGDCIQFNSYIGFKTIGGTKLAEIKNNGSFVISGTTYYTTQSTVNYAASATFDSFDFSEVYQVDQEYTAGTIVCPSDTQTPIAYDGTPQSALPIMSQCTHDACNLAGVIVSVPAFCAGAPNVPSMGDEYDSTQPMKQAVAHSGRIFMKTAYNLTGNTYVCSDGRGGVRACAAGEKVLALGVVISPTVSGMVPVMIRPTYVSL